VKDFSLPPPYEKIHDAQATIWDFEVARCLTGEYSLHRDHIREPFTWEPARATIRLGVNYVGLWDELSMYDRALSDAAIEALYHLSGGVAVLLK